MKNFKYLQLVLNLLEFLKENLDKKTWQKIKNVLKSEKYVLKCDMCGCDLRKIRKDFYYCDNCDKLYHIERSVLND